MTKSHTVQLDLFKFSSGWRHKLIPKNYPHTVQLDLSLENVFRYINVIYMWNIATIEIIKVKYDKRATF